MKNMYTSAATWLTSSSTTWLPCHWPCGCYVICNVAATSSWHVDQPDHDTWTNQIKTRNRPGARQRPTWNRATLVASVESSHVSCQHARRHVAVTSMTKSVTIVLSHRRRAVTWRKMCSSRKMSSSVTKMADSSRCDKCDTLSMTISKSS
jgi:hypothetical protein